MGRPDTSRAVPAVQRTLTQHTPLLTPFAHAYGHVRRDASTIFSPACLNLDVILERWTVETLGFCRHYVSLFAM